MMKIKCYTPAYVFNKYAKEYQSKYMDVNLYHGSLDIFCENINKENAAILDIACGPGNITKYILEKCPSFKILGVDLAPDMIELAKVNCPTAEFQIMDGREVNKLTNKFDGVICGFCMPYLSKEETLQLIRNTADLLNGNGVFYLSTMEGKYAQSGLEKGSSGDKETLFIHYHEMGYLQNELENNGFEIIDLQRVPIPPKDGKRVGGNDLILVAKKIKS